MWCCGAAHPNYEQWVYCIAPCLRTVLKTDGDAVIVGVNSDEYDPDKGVCLTRFSKPNTDELWVHPVKSKVPMSLEDRTFSIGDIVQRAGSSNIEVGRVCDVTSLCVVHRLRNDKYFAHVPTQCLTDACPLQVGTPVLHDRVHLAFLAMNVLVLVDDRCCVVTGVAGSQTVRLKWRLPSREGTSVALMSCSALHSSLVKTATS